MRRWPWTIARMVPSWSRMTWAILASVPTAYSSSTLADLLLLARALGDQRDRLGGADGTVERLDAPVAADLEGDDHLGEDDRVAQGDERQDLERDPGSAPFSSSPAPFSAAISGRSWVSSVATGKCSFSRSGCGELRLVVVVLGESLYIVLIEQVVDPDLARVPRAEG